MSRTVLRSLTILTLVAVVLSATAWTVSFVQGQLPKQDAQSADNTKRKTFREMAQEADIEGDVREGEFDTEYTDLRWLAKDSDAVLLGRISEEDSFFDGNDYILTKYMVDVYRIVKDGTSDAIPLWQSLGRPVPTPLTTRLGFVRPGGTVYVNRHRASLKLKGSEFLTSGKTYVIFLQWTGGYYRLAGGMSGAVLIEDDSRTKPLGTNKALRKYDGLSLEAFIEEVLAKPIQ